MHVCVWGHGKGGSGDWGLGLGSCDLQCISSLVHAAGASQNKAGVGVLHPLLHLTPELAPPSQPSQERFQVVTVKVGPAPYH